MRGVHTVTGIKHQAGLGLKGAEASPASIFAASMTWDRKRSAFQQRNHLEAVTMIQWVKCLPEFSPQPGMVMHACNPSTVYTSLATCGGSIDPTCTTCPPTFTYTLGHAHTFLLANFLCMPYTHIKKKNQEVIKEDIQYQPLVYAHIHAQMHPHKCVHICMNIYMDYMCTHMHKIATIINEGLERWQSL